LIAVSPTEVELGESWIVGDPEARWRSSSGHGASTGAAASGSSLLEVPPGCRVPRHTDSAEETIVVTAGRAGVTVGEEHREVPAGGLALVPADEPHEVRSTGNDALRFVAVYASTDVVTIYEEEVQPSGSRARKPVA
jgi:quercetin dioxygenase-like cupin family protein